MRVCDTAVAPVRRLLIGGAIALLLSCPASAVEIEGVQPAALDQPRINVCLRRDAKGPPLEAKGGAAKALADLLGGAVDGGGGGGGGGGKAINIRAFLDTGASGVMISQPTAEALGLNRANDKGRPVEFHDVGVGGTEAFGVSEPLFVSVAPTNGGGGDEPTDASQYAYTFGPVRTQLAGGGMMDLLTGGLDVVGMPAMKGRVVVIDPKPVDTFGDTMRAAVLDPRKDRSSIPKVDRTVMLSRGSFERFTRTEPAGARGPTMADNPFVGPSPVTGGAGSAKPRAAIPPVVVALNGKQSAGSWLLDTGAAASMICKAQAEKLGITYVAETEGTGSPKLAGVPEAEQFTLPVGGVGGQKTVAGFYLDTLTLPTRERDPLVYRRAPVLVMDITVEDPATKQTVTLDGVLGMNYFAASANVSVAGGLPDIGNLTVGAYSMIVFDEPAGTLGLKLKTEFLKGARPGRSR